MSRISPSSSIRSTVLVTEATGSCGTVSCFELLKSKLGHGIEVHAAVHATSPKIGDEQWKRQFASVRPIDAEDPTSLDFRGIDCLFIIPSNDESRVSQVINYVDTAKRYNVGHILLLSLIGAEARNTLFSRQFREMELSVQNSGIPCTFLRVTFFTENFFLQADKIRDEDALYLPIRRGRFAPLSIEDVAKAACAILCRADRHTNRAYDLVGPELLDGDEIAFAASRGLGREVVFRDCSTSEIIDLQVSEGLARWQATGMAEIMEMIAKAEMPALKTRDFFEDLTGSRGFTVEEFFAKHREFFTSESKARTFGKLITPVEGTTADGGTATASGQSKEETSRSIKEHHGSHRSDVPARATSTPAISSVRREGEYSREAVSSREGGYSNTGTSYEVDELHHLVRQLLREQELFVSEQRRGMGREERRLETLRNIQRSLESTSERGGECEATSERGGISERERYQPESTKLSDRTGSQQSGYEKNSGRRHEGGSAGTGGGERNEEFSQYARSSHGEREKEPYRGADCTRTTNVEFKRPEYHLASERHFPEREGEIGRQGGRLPESERSTLGR